MTDFFLIITKKIRNVPKFIFQKQYFFLKFLNYSPIVLFFIFFILTFLKTAQSNKVLFH